VVDELLLDRAAELGRLLITNDTDLLRIGHERQSTSKFFAGVAYAPQQGPPVGKLIENLELIVRALSREEIVNQVFYLPL